MNFFTGVFSAALIIATQLFGSTNPDGGAWMPSLEGFGGVDMGRTAQKATLTKGALLPVDVQVTAGVEWLGGIALKLPLTRALSLGGGYSQGNSSWDYEFNSGPAHWIDTVATRNSSMSFHATLFTQGFFREKKPSWGLNASPDGRYWFPALGLSWISAEALQHEDDKDVPTGIVFRTHDYRFDSRYMESTALLPFPDYGAVFGNYGRSIQHSFSDADHPERNYTDGGDEQWWGLGLHYIVNMDGGDRNRGWNPLGKEDSVKFSFSYAEYWAHEIRSSHGYHAHADWVITSYASAGLGLNLDSSDRDPYSSSPGLTVTNQSVSHFHWGGLLNLTFFIPGSIAERPWVEETTQEKPSAEAVAAQKSLEQKTAQEESEQMWRWRVRDAVLNRGY